MTTETVPCGGQEASHLLADESQLEGQIVSPGFFMLQRVARSGEPRRRK